MNFTILRFDSIDSTNTEAARQAKLGADEGVAVLARQQTAGRGRHGRSWVSGKDSGLYVSIVLRPKIDVKYLPLITLMTGVSVSDTLAEIGLKPDIKWVNDVLVGDKKISGILAETADTPKGLAVVVGIGVNLTSSNFPNELAYIATSIKQETGRTIRADELSEKLTKFFGYFYDILCADDGPAEIVREWQRRSTYYAGKPVRVALENGSVSGITAGLETNGALRIRGDDGRVTVVQAGDVERLRKI